MFDFETFSRELDLIDKGGYAQFRQFTVDVSVHHPGTGEKDLIEFAPGANGLLLLPHAFEPSQQALVSSNTAAALFVRFNQITNPWLRFSLISNSNDFISAAGTFRRMWVRTDESVGPQSGGVFYFLAVLGITLTGGNLPSLFGYTQNQGGGGAN